jgi:hypothetical protein
MSSRVGVRAGRCACSLWGELAECGGEMRGRVRMLQASILVSNGSRRLSVMFDDDKSAREALWAACADGTVAEELW